METIVSLFFGGGGVLCWSIFGGRREWPLEKEVSHNPLQEQLRKTWSLVKVEIEFAVHFHLTIHLLNVIFVSRPYSM